MKKRSQLLKPPKEVVPPPRDLTEEEEEFLEYFTDFCKYTDDPKEYGIDTRVDPTLVEKQRIRQELYDSHALLKKESQTSIITYL